MIYRTATPPPESPGIADYGELNEKELATVRQGRCPDCSGIGFLGGPSGGLCQNFKCANPQCGSRFNDMGPFGIERISRPSPEKGSCGCSSRRST